MQDMAVRLSGYLSKLSLPSLGVTDILEIALISFFIYQFMVWIKFTRAYTLLKGILIVLLFILFAYVLKMNTILWIIKNLSTILLTSVVVIFQPELRKMLEQLGQKKFMASIFPLDAGKEVQERFTDKTINELVKACFDMGEVRTGALIVIEQNIRLSEYERTGINVDAVLTSQLLINIFEHNTPLHDGAVLVRGNRIVAATCYLPLSDNMELSKQLGTRHRAGVGISEVSDSLTIIVSEETGQVSMAQNGQLSRGLTSAELRSALIKASCLLQICRQGYIGLSNPGKKSSLSCDCNPYRIRIIILHTHHVCTIHISRILEFYIFSGNGDTFTGYRIVHIYHNKPDQKSDENRHDLQGKIPSQLCLLHVSFFLSTDDAVYC